MTMNHHRHMPYLQQAQVYYKAGILNSTACSILRQVVRIGLPPIALSREDRTTRDEGIIKLLLYFLRNVTAIQQAPNLPSQGLDNEVSRSATIQAFLQQDVFALLLTICSNMGEDFNLQDVIVLEILFDLIKGVDVEKLWMTEDQRKGEELSELNYALSVEKGWQRDFKKNGPLGWSRHGRFGTMIWVKRDDEKMTTVSGQDNLKDSRHALFNMDRSKKWSKPQQKRKDLDHTIHDFDRSTRLTSSATEMLRNFVEEFLDSGFNPLFTHLRKAIEREAERLLDVNYRQFFYAVSWFLQAERVRRRKAQQEAKDKPEKLTLDFEAESYALVAAVLNQETFIMLNRYMQQAYDNKEWQDLNAGMRCFTQILLTVQEMAQSRLEEDQEIAENIQNRIFYEETTHDRIVAILRGYKDQGFGYLDACTELAHTFLRMLERYSKENVDLQIRSKRRARRKKKDRDIGSAPEQDPSVDVDNDDQDQSEAEELASAAQVSRERKFDFNRFAAKFSTQSSVDTYVALMTFYRDLTPDQLKRAHRFFHRVAFKQDLAVLLYRVDIIALFYRLIKGPEGLDNKSSAFSDWSELIKQVLKKMFKKLEARPELVVEMLFSKINATLYYLEFGQEKQTLQDTRPPVAVEVRAGPGRGSREKIGIVVTAICRAGQSDLVKWIVGVLGNVIDERRGFEDARAAAESLQPSAVSEESTETQAPAGLPLENVEPVKIQPSEEDIRTAVFKNPRLRLLMALLGLERGSGDDVLGTPWVVPSTLNSTQLQESKYTIEHFIAEPWRGIDADETPESLIKRVRNIDGATSTNQYEDDGFIVASGPMFGEDSEVGSENEFLFPDNVRTKRKSVADQVREKRQKRKRGSDDEDGEASEMDDEGLAARRKAREDAALERRRKIKSELRIRDSDDETDDERDRDFFRMEEIRRREQETRVHEAMRLGRKEDKSDPRTNGKRKRQAKNRSGENPPHSKKRKSTTVDAGASGSDDDLIITIDTGLESGSEISDDDDDDEQTTATASSQPHRNSTSPLPAPQTDGNETETPLSSPRLFSSPLPGPGRALKELSQPRADPILSPTTALKTSNVHLGGLENAVVAEEDEEEEEQVIVPAGRRRIRAGFVFDSDDE